MTIRIHPDLKGRIPYSVIKIILADISFITGSKEVDTTTHAFFVHFYFRRECDYLLYKLVGKYREDSFQHYIHYRGEISS